MLFQAFWEDGGAAQRLDRPCRLQFQQGQDHRLSQGLLCCKKWVPPTFLSIISVGLIFNFSGCSLTINYWKSTAKTWLVSMTRTSLICSGTRALSSLSPSCQSFFMTTWSKSNFAPQILLCLYNCCLLFAECMAVWSRSWWTIPSQPSNLDGITAVFSLSHYTNWWSISTKLTGAMSWNIWFSPKIMVVIYFEYRW